MPDKISVLLVDDHSLVRRGFRRILEDEPDIEVMGEAGDGAEAVRLAQELQPTVIVMDCAMPNMNGLQATRKILEKQPQTLVLMLSMHPEETLVRQALDAGARGYVLKNAVDLELGAAIRRVVAGETVLDSQLSRPSTLKGDRDQHLTPRELEILQMIVEGKSNKEIAVSSRSKRKHRGGTPRQHHGCAGNPQDRRVGGLRHPQRAGKSSVNRRHFLCGMAGLASTSGLLLDALAAPASNPGFRLVDVTAAAGLQFRHNSGAYGGKLLPETLGAGCAFLDYDGDGWQDILLINGMDWPGHKRERSTLEALSQQS